MKSFPPIVGENPKVLILGSMPGQKSLEHKQYYGHPQNSFWWIMSNILGFSSDLSYEQRVSKLEMAYIAVWDVLAECQRKGSLDANIVRQTEIPNDIEKFVNNHASIKLIVFNGGAARSIFNRHQSKEFKNNKELSMLQLPSTSPAHASMTRVEKSQVWCDAIKPILFEKN